MVVPLHMLNIELHLYIPMSSDKKGVDIAADNCFRSLAERKGAVMPKMKRLYIVVAHGSHGISHVCLRRSLDTSTPDQVNFYAENQDALLGQEAFSGFYHWCQKMPNYQVEIVATGNLSAEEYIKKNNLHPMFLTGRAFDI